MFQFRFGVLTGEAIHARLNWLGNIIAPGTFSWNVTTFRQRSDAVRRSRELLASVKIRRHPIFHMLAMISLLMAFGSGCRPQPPTLSDTPMPMLLCAAGTSANGFPHLHNLTQVSDQIYSGGEPQGQDAFAELQKLGVRTIVSVDGARPQVELAEEYGLSYVHIPIGYDGISEIAGNSFARVMRDCDGPIYFHCHHGKHRGPAAAAVACVASGVVDGEAALEILRRAGTSEDYAGLWRDVENYQPPSIHQPLPELVSFANVGTMATAMAQIDRAKDNLALAQAANWSAVEEHPDIVAAQEALILREALHETGRHLSGDYAPEFKVLLEESESTAGDLELALKRQQYEAADLHFGQLLKSCRQCHSRHRD